MMRNLTASPLSLTFVGEVRQGLFSQEISPIRRAICNPVPIEGLLSTMDFPAVDGSVLRPFSSSQEWLHCTYYEGYGWFPDATIRIGEGFLAESPSGFIWQRHYSIWP
jgi:hypothetical protein